MKYVEKAIVVISAPIALGMYLFDGISSGIEEFRKDLAENWERTDKEDKEGNDAGRPE